MKVIEGGFGREVDEDEVINDMVAVLEAAIVEIAQDPIDFVVVVTMAGADINNIRIEGLGGHCSLRAAGVLHKAAIALAAGG